MNPLFKMMGGNIPMMGGQMAQFPKLMQMFNSFKNGFSGNPQQIVQEMLNSGRMSQEQFNQLSQAATQFQQMMGVK